MKQTVTGVFQTYDEARHAQDALLQRGFAADDIDLPARSEGVLAGIERLVGSLFSSTGDLRRTTETQTGMTPAPGEAVRIGVHVSDEAHANLAYETLREEHATEVALRGTPWAWPATDRPVAREHSALDELGLSEFADAMRRRAAQAEAAREQASANPSVDPAVEPMRPTSEAEATVLTSASAPGAGAVMGAHHVDVPGAPEATRPAAGVAPQIPDEFLEYEEDTPEHHKDMPGQRRTLH
ncbi:hypothetical protein [Paraburkholderia silvatlantica]|uniref:Uncharacterized protein n=1 Tax=Paraburkholderia silvatlantica TaxID=321895 RepID=A0A2U1AFX7_9BURK|nr:hypothetical protein [Paraburkholderia silvatlantica]MBB2928671.1 hypothetical protein [Paraburkholderia silvatlantica]PVY35257.1 hypothetical protein C7411_10550 [Paraburkholderia silvatlantica]PXW40899.1 hypothetical protein C7413_10350 [Paraburkholderia silvatlantica]PYE27365.1 hypothetical protein C7410_10248 [Paraburkholderia silvatlantica]TDQ98275.1 hypothetical protein C7412_106250 [Paraburkholderia silvatlantica]